MVSGRVGVKQQQQTSQTSYRRLVPLATHLQVARPLKPTPSALDNAFGGEKWNNGQLLAPREITQADQGCPAGDSQSAELTKAEAAQFRLTGYLIKRGLIPAEELLPFVQRLWDEAPDCVSRDKPESWVDPRWVNTPPDRPGHGSNYQVLSGDARWWWGEIGHDPAFMDATCRHPKVLHLVESLLGGPIKLPSRNRGLYTVWPRSRPALSLGPHVDSQSEELLATTYLGPVGANDGPFTIWPGSHASMWCASDEEINWVQNDEFKERMDKIRAETQPLLFTGDIGDTIFWHARLVHSSGVHFGRNVRIAAISDFRRCWPSSQLEWMVRTPEGHLTMRVKGHEENGQTVGGASAHVRDGTVQSILPSLMWHHDVLEIDERRRPTNRDNMFGEWNLGAQPAVGNIVEEDPWWVKYKVHPDWRGDGTDRPRPPRELAERLKAGAVFNVQIGEWVDPKTDDR